MNKIAFTLFILFFAINFTFASSNNSNLDYTSKFEQCEKYTKNSNYVALKKEALKLISSNVDHDKIIYLNAYFYLNRANRYLGDLISAIEFANKSLVLAKELNDSTMIMHNLTDLGSYYSQLKGYDKAMNYLKKANSLSLALKNKNASYATYSNIGNVYAEQEKNDSAIFYFQLAQKIYQKIYQKKSPIILNNFSYVYSIKKMHDSSFYYAKRALRIVPKDQKYLLANIYSLLGANYLILNKLDSATIFSKKGLHLSLKNKQLQISSECYKTLIEIYKTQNNLALAIENYELYTTLKDSSFQLMLENEVEIVETKGEIERKKLHIDKLQIEKELESNKKQFLIIVLILTAIIGIVLYIQKVKIKQTNKVIVKDLINLKNAHEELVLMRIEKNKSRVKDTLNNETKKELKDLGLTSKDKITLSKEQESFIELSIRNAFDIEKIYLDKNLTLNKLATKIGSNRVYLSYVFNNIIKSSFSDMLNNFRVNEAKILLLDEKNINFTFEAIAEKSGFNSKATFNRSFKKITGITPSVFIKTAKSQDFKNQ